MDKPFLDCNLNNPPLNVDRSDWQLKMFSDFSFHLNEFGPDYITWLVCPAHNKHSNANSVKRRIRHLWNCFLDAGTSPNFSISTSFLKLLKNDKPEHIVLLIAYYFIRLMEIFLQQWEKGKWRSAKACHLYVFKGGRGGGVSQVSCRCCLISFEIFDPAKTKIETSWIH